MELTDKLRKIGPWDQWLFNSSGDVVGVRNPNMKGQDLRPPRFSTDASGNVTLEGPSADYGLLTVAQAQAIALQDYDLSYAPTRGSALAYGVQFRGAADTAASLGALGLTINDASDAAASSRLIASTTDWSSTLNGASLTGRTLLLGPYTANILRVYMGELGLAGPYVKQDSGAIASASLEMLKLVWDTSLNIRALLVYEGPPTDFAGAAGTGSARTVTVSGLAITA